MLTIESLQYAEPRSAGVDHTRPREFMSVGEYTYFRRHTEPPALWRTDGTADGTIELGTYESQLRRGFEVGNRLAFVGCTSRVGCEFHTTDGSIDGTVVLTDSLPSRQTNQVAPRPFWLGNTTANHFVFGSMVDQDQMTVWSSDGTPEGTSTVTQIRLASVTTTASRDGLAYFAGREALFVGAANEVWVSDGTADGTQRISEFESSEFVIKLLPVAGKLFVATDRALYVVGSQSGETRRLFSLTLDAAFTITPVGDSLFYVIGSKLQHYDAAQEGTRSTTLATGFVPRARPIQHVHNDKVFFALRNEIWVTDGTEDGTFQLLDSIFATSFATTEQGITIVLALTSVGDQPNHHVLWRTDGTTSGTKMIEGSLRPWKYRIRNPRIDKSGAGVVISQISSARYFVDSQGAAAVSAEEFLASHEPNRIEIPWMGADTGYFLGSDPLRGLELWRWEDDEPVLVKDFFSTPIPTSVSHVFSSGEYLYFIEDGPLELTESAAVPYSQLWRTDGTTEGTERIDFPPIARSHVVYGGQVGERHAFQVQYEAGASTLHELWVIDGAHVARLSESYSITSSVGLTFASPPTATHGTVWFETQRLEQHSLAVTYTDGTRAGTRSTHAPTSYTWAAVVNGEAISYLDSTIKGGGATHHLVNQRITTAAKAGDVLVVAVAATKDLPNKLFYRTSDSVVEIAEVPGAVSEFVFFDDRLLFRSGASLWVTDGSSNGTYELADNIDPELIGEAGGEFIFAGNSSETGRELWRTDGTAPGTRLLADLSPGPKDSTFSRIPAESQDEKLYFFADDGVHGMELWVTDGTNKGTRLVEETAPGPKSLSITGFSVTKNMIALRTDEAVPERNLLIMRPAPNLADIDLNGKVDFGDFLAFAANYLSDQATAEQGDFDGDGIVSDGDFEILARNFGRTQSF